MNPTEQNAMRAELHTATKSAYFLAEGPCWDRLRNRVLWVDIMDGAVYAGQLAGDGGIRVVERIGFPEPVGAVAVAVDGTLLVASGEHLWTRRDSGAVAPIARVIPPGGLTSPLQRRVNDGKTDPQGRFVVGTLAMGGDSETETLSRLEPDGTMTLLDDDLTLSNGIAWTQSGEVMYSVDTMRRRIHSRAYGPDLIGPRELFVELESGYPDGICIDAEDHLWVAVWGSGEVRRYSPEGQLVHRIEVPAPHVTSVAFAGLQLDTLIITSATKDLTPEQLTAFPLSGRLFTTLPGVRGIEPNPWVTSVANFTTKGAL